MDPTPHKKPSRPCDARRVLVLQGGGALGAYQAGAYQALCHHDFEPQWLAGISIGAINAAIIAGNPREQRVDKLKQFWEMASSPVPWQPLLHDDHAHSLFNETSAAVIATFGVPGFFTPRFPPTHLLPSGKPSNLSYYDTAPLRSTLERLVDFDRLNHNGIRLSVGAVNIVTGNFVYFDTTKQTIGPEHIMASAALPPGFPAIEIDGAYYWDGGVASNTPLDYVLDCEQRENLLIFQIDLFSARGRLPETLLEAAEREKDIRYSSRTRLNTDKNKMIHNTRKALRDLIDRLPAELRDDPAYAILHQAAQENAVTVVHLIYRKRDYEASSKDYDFSRLNMTEHWKAGEQDVYVSMRDQSWQRAPQDGETMVTWDLTRDAFE